MYTIPYLLAVGDGNMSIDAPFFQIAQQFAVLQGTHPNIFKSRLSFFVPWRLRHNRTRTCPAPCDESRPQKKILTPDECSCQVEDVATFANAKVEPYVSIYINLEGGSPLRAVRSGIPQDLSSLFCRTNPHRVQEVRNGDFSHSSCVHCQSIMIFSPIPYCTWKCPVAPPHRQRSLP